MHYVHVYVQGSGELLHKKQLGAVFAKDLHGELTLDSKIKGVLSSQWR